MKIMIQGGTGKKPILLLFTDIGSTEEMFEDICHIIKIGYIPNQFTKEQKAKISE